LTFGGHFVACKLEGEKLKIRLGNRAHRIQHASIMLKSLIFHFYPNMHLTFTILRNASSLNKLLTVYETYMITKLGSKDPQTSEYRLVQTEVRYSERFRRHRAKFQPNRTMRGQTIQL